MFARLPPKVDGGSSTFQRNPLTSLYITGVLTPPLSQIPCIHDNESKSLPQRLDAILKAYCEQENVDKSPLRAPPVKAPLLTFLEKNKIPLTIIVPTGMLQAPFQSLWTVREFMERKTLPVSAPSQLESLSRFSVQLPIGHDDEMVQIRVLDGPQAARLSMRDWHGVVGIFVSLVDWQYNQYPYGDLKSLSQSVRLMLAKFEDDLELPKHLQSIQLVQLRFKDRARFNDQICWVWGTVTQDKNILIGAQRDMTTALQSKLSRPYDFSRLEMRTN